MGNRKTALSLEEDLGIKHIERFASVKPSKVNLYKVDDFGKGLLPENPKIHVEETDAPSHPMNAYQRLQADKLEL